jgi:O-antigen/teichoic acid export membrane protein
MRLSIELLILSVFCFVIGMMFVILAGANWFDNLFNEIEEKDTKDDNLDYRYKIGIGFLFLSVILFIISLVLFFKGK